MRRPRTHNAARVGTWAPAVATSKLWRVLQTPNNSGVVDECQLASRSGLRLTCVQDHLSKVWILQGSIHSRTEGPSYLNVTGSSTYSTRCLLNTTSCTFRCQPALSWPLWSFMVLSWSGYFLSCLCAVVLCFFLHLASTLGSLTVSNLVLCSSSGSLVWTIFRICSVTPCLRVGTGVLRATCCPCNYRSLFSFARCRAAFSLRNNSASFCLILCVCVCEVAMGTSKYKCLVFCSSPRCLCMLPPAEQRR